MKRRELRRHLINICAELSRRDYSEWDPQQFPMTFQRTVDDTQCSVELTLLEYTSEYIHIGVSIDLGGLGSYIPVSSSVIAKVRSGRSNM